MWVSMLWRVCYSKIIKRQWIIYSGGHSDGAPGGAVGLGTELQAGGSRVRFPMVSLEFFIDIFLSDALWP